MRDAFPEFESNDIKLYALSYDDQDTLSQFAEKQSIPYTLLSDVDSAVIRQYGILNTQVSEDDFILWGIPYPGVYICNEEGVVTAKFFHDTYKKRDSAQMLIDAAMGKIALADDAPQAQGGDESIKITAAVHGGNGSIRQGIIRKAVVRFEMSDGLHIYGEPVPEGMVATSIDISGHEGIRVLEPEFPPTEPLYLEAMDVNLQVWSGQVDLVVPFYPTGELVSETRPLDMDSIDIQIKVRYQACTDQECLLPTTETFTLKLPLDVIDIPKIGLHTGHGQREGNYDGSANMRRLMWRKFMANPLSIFKFVAKTIRLERQAKNAAKKHPNKRQHDIKHTLVSISTEQNGMADDSYEPPKVWTWNPDSNQAFGNINRPTAGAQQEQELPVGKHPLQLYSLGTPNGVKVTIMLEELVELGYEGAEYDAWLVNIIEGKQFESGFVDANPNSKIPALVDHSVEPKQRVFESGSILLYLAEKFGEFLPKDHAGRTETLNWLFWQMGATPLVGGGFGHFYAYAPIKIEYAINRYTMEAKRQLSLLDNTLAERRYIAGDHYSIADMAIWPWYGSLIRNQAYDAAEFLEAEGYKNLIRYVDEIWERPAVQRGQMVNRPYGKKSSQLLERHDKSDFELRTQDILDPDPPEEQEAS